MSVGRDRFPVCSDRAAARTETLGRASPALPCAVAGAGSSSPDRSPFIAHVSSACREERGTRRQQGDVVITAPRLSKTVGTCHSELFACGDLGTLESHVVGLGELLACRITVAKEKRSCEFILSQLCKFARAVKLMFTVHEGAYFRSSYAWAQICESSRSQLLQTKSCEAPKSQQLVVAKRCEYVNSKLSETKSCVNRLSLLFTQRRPVDVCLRS